MAQFHTASKHNTPKQFIFTSSSHTPTQQSRDGDGRLGRQGQGGHTHLIDARATAGEMYLYLILTKGHHAHNQSSDLLI